MRIVCNRGSTMSSFILGNAFFREDHIPPQQKVPNKPEQGGQRFAHGGAHPAGGQGKGDRGVKSTHDGKGR